MHFFETGLVLFWGLGLMLYVLKLLRFHPANPQWSSGWCSILDHQGRGFESYRHSSRIFFLSIWRDLHLHEHFQLEISSKCDIKAENSSTLCKFHEGRKGLQPMGSNADCLPSCLSLAWGELLVLSIESNMPFCACVCLMRMPYAYALVKTRLYSHLRLSYYHSIIDSIDTHFIQYLTFYFSTSFPKIMCWLFTEVYKKIMSNDLRSKDMISPLRIHAVGLFQACSLFLTRKKKRKSCAFLLPSFWFTVFLSCHYCGVKRYFYDTGLKSKALWVLVA